MKNFFKRVFTIPGVRLPSVPGLKIVRGLYKVATVGTFIAVAFTLAGAMLFPGVLPPWVSITYATGVPAIIPTVIMPERPHTHAVSTRAIKDTYQVAEASSRPVVYLSRLEIKEILARTGWRNLITGPTVQIEDGQWVQDDRFFDQIFQLVMCESSGRPDAIGDPEVGPSLGLFQINLKYWSEIARGSDLFDPVDNAEIAFRIWKISGESFRLWSCDPTKG